MAHMAEMIRFMHGECWRIKMRFCDEPMSDEQLKDFSENFDHNRADFKKNPYEIYRTLRNRCPVAHTDAHGGFWIPTTYETVAGIALDDDNFSSRQATIPQYYEPNLPPVTYDPPESTEYRMMMMPLMSQSAVKRHEPFLQNLARETMNGFIEKGEADLVQDFVRRIAYGNAMKITGLPAEKADEIMNIVVGGVLGTLSPEAYMEGTVFVHAEIRAAMERQKKEPVPGALISHLLHDVTIMGGRKPTEEEIDGAVMLTLGGSSDTTVATTGTTLYYLGEHPETRQRLIDEPGLWATALEEFLRYVSPTQALARVVAKDCMIGDTAVKKGDQVLLPWAAANWDGNKFPNPDQLILDRTPNRHLAFGTGSHICLGAHMARVMVRAMLREVLNRMPDYKVIREGVRKAPSANVVQAFINVPVTFTPGKRI